jgi:hypothetical protein
MKDVWVVTALDSEFQWTVIGVYATEALAMEAEELCRRCAVASKYGAFSEAERSRVRVEEDTKDLQLMTLEIEESDNEDSSEVFGHGHGVVSLLPSTEKSN